MQNRNESSNLEKETNRNKTIKIHRLKKTKSLFNKDICLNMIPNNCEHEFDIMDNSITNIVGEFQSNHIFPRCSTPKNSSLNESKELFPLNNYNI